MKTLCLSIAHSIKDKGLYSNNKLISEYDLCLKLGERIKNKLILYDIQTFIINALKDGGSTGMTGKIKALQKFSSDCFIELHLNSQQNSYNDTEIFYFPKSNKSIELGKIIQNNFYENFYFNNIKLDISKEWDSPLYQLDKPTILIKLFPIDNDIKLTYYINNLTLMTNLIVNSINTFYKIF